VKTQPLHVPVLLNVRAPEGESQIQLCWNTATGAWYRVEHGSTLATPVWKPLTAWIPGDGNPFCTNQAILTGQQQKFYRIISTNAPPGRR
jgi:hypothetical protein